MQGRARAALVIALVVLCSALAGAALDRAAMLHLRRRTGMGPPAPNGPPRATREQDARRRAEMLDHLTKDLSLSASQRAGIDSVMKRTDSSLRLIRTEMQPRLTKVFEESRADIFARLDSTQRAKFDEAMPRRGRR